jgi:phage terminase large subunit GpA-like protein
MPIRAACIDSGHATKAVYEFCRTRFARRVWAVKGKGGPGVPLWPRRPSRGKSSLPIFLVGVDTGKDTLFSRLKITETGPGCVHFAKNLDPSYFRQLTAEKVVTRFAMGRPIRTWQSKRPGERNEALDCYNYSLAALHGLIAAGMSLNRETSALADTPLRAAGAPAPATAPRPSTIKSAWMNW